MSTITFAGSTVWQTNDAVDTGTGWYPSWGSIPTEIVEATAELGTGTWLKPAGQRPTEHSIRVLWITDGVSALKSAVEALADGRVGTLATPTLSVSNCRLLPVSGWEIAPTIRSNARAYAVQVTLTFRQYPRSS